MKISTDYSIYTINFQILHKSENHLHGYASFYGRNNQNNYTYHVLSPKTLSKYSDSFSEHAENINSFKKIDKTSSCLTSVESGLWSRHLDSYQVKKWKTALMFLYESDLPSFVIMREKKRWAQKGELGPLFRLLFVFFPFILFPDILKFVFISSHSYFFLIILNSNFFLNWLSRKSSQKICRF